ncbi:A disintegrin and metalloproteinase with thrombospondin motifs adt-2-like [Bradysia coprophila]|uniref:A disintegrin and metalloproteinase with thrombospondin motifs adt-2-like n=1 Tax=Bradysia coprophila TaxID=38358 RepID=UPI00187DB40E|nr:A disintegrin and metalloproteinase with thrombospondin motifs adt-2-like [Bradysia coprophila]
MLAISQVCLVLVVFVDVISTSVLFNKDSIHHFMDEKELQYYFGTESKFHVPHYEVIDIAARERPENEIEDTVHFNLKAFDEEIPLKLKINKNLVSPFMRFVEKFNGTGERELHGRSNDCHYLHNDEETSAAISGCSSNNINGIILRPSKSYEVKSLNDRLKSIFNGKNPDRNATDNFHIVKIIDNFFSNETNNFFVNYPGQPESIRQLSRKLLRLPTASKVRRPILPERRGHKIKRGTKERKTTVEIGVFFDAAAYHTFAPYFDYDSNKIRNMLLAYINGVQSLYHHPSLGTPIDLTIVYMEIMTSQPVDLPHYHGERGSLLDSFCNYQKNINPEDDKNPNHWDMGLYISGLDFFAYENGQRSTVTMGLAAVGGVCIDQYACVIAEFGTKNVFGKPYPSAGFTSVYIMAHEIGHNLGMHHDSSGNSCPSEGYVMSPSRGTQGETTWSSCSADVVSKINYEYSCLDDKPPSVPIDFNSWKYEGFPGQVFTAKKQCELLLIDNDAVVSQTNGYHQICNNLHCRSPHRSGYYFAGPALDGTDCGPDKWCEGGVCGKKRPFVKPIEYVKGGWSDWMNGTCKSDCLMDGLGHQRRERKCDNPTPVNTDEGCSGPAYTMALCSDSEICSDSDRRSVIDFATDKCREFSKILDDLDPDGFGLQAPHEYSRLWMGCAIFCKRKNSGAYYTPRFELNDLGADPYFPDGTWCHADESQNYYCRQHHCLPRNFEITKLNFWDFISEDLPGSWNARPNALPLDDKIIQYLSIDENGKPLLTHLDSNELPKENDEDWESKDYVDLPHQQMDEA